MAVLAALALAVQLAVPQGFMPARANGAPTLVICTGHGPLVAMPDQAPGKTSDTPCTFAAHVAAPVAVAIPIRAPYLVAYAKVVSPGVFATEPDSGLAAPPPPSQAPPLTTL